MSVRMGDTSTRKRTTDAVVADLRARLTGFPDTKVFVSSRGAFLTRLLTRGSSQDRLEVEIRGHNLETGSHLAEQVKALMSEVPGVVDARINREEGKPELAVVVDRDKASTLGLQLLGIADTVNTAMTGSVATRYRDRGDEFDVRIRLKDDDRSNIEQLKGFVVMKGDGEPIALGNIARIEEQRGYVNIERRNQMRVLAVSAGASGRDVGSISADIQAKLTTLDVPRDFSVQLIGEREDQQQSTRSMIIVFMLAVALVYMVMAAQFESLLHPFVIMFSIPFAAIGVVLILFFTGTNVSMPVYIGGIMLTGIVVNNAIVLVDYTNLLRSRGADVIEAIVEAGGRRLRPILMTTLTTALALVPMALGIGSGAEMQAPMARTVCGGLLVAMLFTLFFVPTVYSIAESLRERLRVASPAPVMATDVSSDD